MPNAFNFAASPFDCLTQEQQRMVRDHVDVAYFRRDEVILDVDAAPTHLRVWRISGSRCLSIFLVELGAAMIVASTIVWG